MSYTLVLEWMPGDLYMSAVTARCTAPTSSYSVVWLPPNKVYQITLYCGSTSPVSFLVGAFRGKAWSYMSISLDNEEQVETVVLLSKGEVDSKKIRVEFSLEDMDMSEFQDGATYPQIKEYVLEHTGLKVSNLYISQIKRKCGIEVGKNYNLPKSEDSRQPQCPPEKEKAIREAFKYFGMI